MIISDSDTTPSGTPEDTGSADPELDAAIEAATKAWGDGPGSDADDDEGDAPEAAPAKPAKAKSSRSKPKAEDDEPAAEAESEAPAKPAGKPARAKLAAFLEAKEHEHRGRSDYERRAAALEAERQAMATQREAIEAEGRRLRAQAAALRENPVATARELGIDPEQLMAGATRELSPEAKLYAELHGVRRQLDETRTAYEQRVKALEDAHKASEAQRAEAYRAHEERAFASEAEAKAPNARLLYGSDRALLREAYAVIENCRSRGLPTPSNADILEFLEYQATEQVARIRGSDAAPKASPPATGKPASGNPLSAKRTSERRSAPARYEDLSADEQDAELFRVARQAWRGGAKAAPRAPAPEGDDDD